MSLRLVVLDDWCFSTVDDPSELGVQPEGRPDRGLTVGDRRDPVWSPGRPRRAMILDEPYPTTVHQVGQLLRGVRIARLRHLGRVQQVPGERQLRAVRRQAGLAVAEP